MSVGADTPEPRHGIYWLLTIEYVSIEDSAVNRTITFRRNYPTECASLLLGWTREYTVLNASVHIQYK